MNSRITITFLLLVITQGLHSIEEYIGRLWEVFAPARFLTGLVSKNPEKGFLVINIGLFIFGLMCWLFIKRNNNTIAKSLILFWVIIELINGIGHPSWAIYDRAYVPGVATAPILLILAIYLAWQLLHFTHDKLKEKNK
ncbi:MAG: HXXEE domain-containing protein [Bacteroidia bacterium]|nr:HXXEE domain-containing protein [Bacteroidia bacterium]